MCCGRLHKLTKEQFRQPRPPRTDPQGIRKEHIKRNPIVRPSAEGRTCPLCEAALRQLQTCCQTTLRCTNYPRCQYRETYDRQGNRK